MASTCGLAVSARSSPARAKIVPFRRAFFGKRTRMCRRNRSLPDPWATPRSRWTSAYRATPMSRITTQPNDQVLWLLHAQADVPGVNYSDDFEVPVFRRTPSPASASEPAASFSNERAERATVPACLPIRCLRRGRSREPESCRLGRDERRHRILLPAFSQSGPGPGFDLASPPSGPASSISSDIPRLPGSSPRCSVFLTSF